MVKLLNIATNRLKTHPNQRYWVFIPFLLIYILIVFLGLKEGFRKDEWRYVYYAENLLQGIYSPEGKVFLWNGPGYPLLLALLMSIKWPLLLIKCLNAFFLYLSLLFFYQSICYYHRERVAFIATVVLGLYLPAFEMLAYLMTEIFTIFLVSAILWTSIDYFNAAEKSNLRLIRLAILLALLALTKVMFGYVFLCLLFIALPIYLVRRKTITLKAIKALFVALAICIPYLGYTYHLTGKIFYWSNAGGMQIYWMSTPHKGEYGDWINFTSKVSQFEDANRLFKERHGKIIADAFEYPNLFSGISTQDLINKSNLRQDIKFKEYAVKNLKANPGRYFRNWRSNVSRMLFDLPYSYKTQTMNFMKYAIFHIPLLFVMLIGVIQIWKKKEMTSIGVLCCLFCTIYLGGSSLVSAYPRQFYIVFPILMFIATDIIARLFNLKAISIVETN